jgi:transcriptional regulator with XRE-family HTH domain
MSRPSHGELLETARLHAKLSIREAARRAGISDNWWRAVVSGSQNGAPANGSPEAVAAMARVVGVTPGQLENEGENEDAARVLRELLREPQPERTAPPSAARADTPPAASGDEYAEVITQLLAEYPTKDWWDLFGAAWRVQESGRLALLRQALLSWRPPADNGVRTEQARENPAS